MIDINIGKIRVCPSRIVLNSTLYYRHCKQSSVQSTSSIGVQMDKQVQQMESLNRAKNGDSLANFPAIISGFMEKGINANEIIPRVNVFTYNAWKALGRQVNKGEHGVKVVTWIDATDKVTGMPTKLCRHSTVFHISQTSQIQ